MTRRNARLALSLLAFACPAFGAGALETEKPTPPSPDQPAVKALSSADWPAPQQTYNLDAPEFTPPDCPAWAKVKVPDWVKPYLGKNGAPLAWRKITKPYSMSTKGIDHYQGNLFVWYRPETAKYLYSEYTPLKVDYKPGTLPAYEKLAAKHTAGCKTDTEKALALLKHMPEYFRHPGMPPLGPPVRADRNMDDEALLATGCGWCNEQARVFIRLCQVLGIPARMIHLWGQNHTMSEFYADGRWCLADTTYMFAVPGKDGKLLSVADCHDGGEGQRAYAVVKNRRLIELSKMSDEALGMADHAKAEAYRQGAAKGMDVEAFAARKDVYFGVMNNPLPK